MYSHTESHKYLRLLFIITSTAFIIQDLHIQATAHANIMVNSSKIKNQQNEQKQQLTQKKQLKDTQGKHAYSSAKQT